VGQSDILSVTGSPSQIKAMRSSYSDFCILGRVLLFGFRGGSYAFYFGALTWYFLFGEVNTRYGQANGNLMVAEPGKN
jgi:hypothetical protein